MSSLAVFGIIVGVVCAICVIIEWVKQVSEILEKKAVDDALRGFDVFKAQDKIESVARKYLPEEYRCPMPGCNGILVVSSGKYGEFLRCNRYPKCAYIRSI